MKQLIILVCLFRFFQSGNAQTFLPTWEHSYLYGEVTPIIGIGSQGFDYNSRFYNNVYLQLGAGIFYSDVNTWGGMDFIPLGMDWKYGGPYIKSKINFMEDSTYGSPVDNQSVIWGNNLEIGGTGGIGAMFLMIPVSINGTLGFATNFNQNALNFGLGVNLMQVTINVGHYYPLYRDHTGIESYPYVDLTLNLWNKK